MTWPRWTRDRVREFVRAATGGAWPGMAAQAQRLLEQLPAEQPSQTVGGRAPAAPRRTGGVDKSRLPFAPIAPGVPKETRTADRNAKVRDIRSRVMRRAREWFGNRCEFCRRYEPVTMHHVLKGADRRPHEDDSTCAALCDDCDKATEASPTAARLKALEWARRLAAEARRRNVPDLAAAFDRTAEILEGKIALARAQEGHGT